MDNKSLAHHGVKGMRWGIRRFQNKDGTRTLLGRKRYSRNDSDSEQKTETGGHKTAKKSIKDMSDEELKTAIGRAELEKKYRDLNPKQVSLGEKFVKDAIIPAATNSVKSILGDYMTKKGKEFLGLNEVADPMKKIKKEVDDLNLKKQYEELIDTEYGRLKKEVNRLTLEKQLKKLREEED